MFLNGSEGWFNIYIKQTTVAVQHILEKRQALYDVAFPHTRKSCFHIVPSSSTAYNARPKR